MEYLLKLQRHIQPQIHANDDNDLKSNLLNIEYVNIRWDEQDLQDAASHLYPVDPVHPVHLFGKYDSMSLIPTTAVHINSAQTPGAAEDPFLYFSSGFSSFVSSSVFLPSFSTSFCSLVNSSISSNVCFSLSSSA